MVVEVLNALSRIINYLIEGKPNNEDESRAQVQQETLIYAC